MIESNFTPEDLLKEFDKVECEILKDSHPEVHKVLVDYLFQNYDIKKKDVQICVKVNDDDYWGLKHFCD